MQSNPIAASAGPKIQAPEICKTAEVPLHVSFGRGPSEHARVSVYESQILPLIRCKIYRFRTR
jgi:hypothetical protein